MTKNSCSLLDLTAVIIGTFTIGSFDMLSDEFPSLFPRCTTAATDDNNKMRSRGYNNRGVPTLVLHGQKGFNEERWSNTSNKSGSGRRLETLKSNASDHIRLQKLEADELYQQSKNVSISCNSSNVAKSIRGGGSNEQQQQQSQDSTGSRKRPYFTYENTRIQLSKTPRRLRTGSKKKKKKIEEKEVGKKKNDGDLVDGNNTEANAKKKASSDTRNSTSGIGKNNCRKRSAASITKDDTTIHYEQQQQVKSTDAQTNNNASTAKATKKKDNEIEVIDLMDDSSDSDDNDDTIKEPAAKSDALSTKPPPPISPPPDGSSTSNRRKQLSPPMKKQQPRQVMSLDNNAQLSNPNPLDLSKPKKKKQKLSVAPPNVPINVDTPSPPEARLSTTTQHTSTTTSTTTTHEVVVKPQPTKASSSAGTPKSKNTKKSPQSQPKPTTNNNKPKQSPVSKLTPKTSAANILTHVLNKPQHNVTMRPIFYNDGSGIDSSQDGKFESQDSSFSTLNGVTMNPDSLYTNGSPRKKEDKTSAATGGGWGGMKPSDKFDGEVFFTQVLPKYQIPPSPKEREDKMRKKEKKKRAATPLTDNYSDEEDMMPKEKKQKTNKPEMKSARGVHHPKYYLLFERSGSLVVIVTSSNLTPQNSTEGSWIQRFEPRSSAPKLSYVQNGCGGVTRSGIDNNNNSASVVDFGMPSDFGIVLQDFLTKQADAAEEGSLSPDVFLRRYVPGLSLGLSSLADQYRFEEAQVHLVSTVPGDYISGLPKNGNRSDATYRPRISYGPQRVSYILSRVFNDGHIKSSKLARASDTGRLGSNTSQEANQSWFHPALKRACERLVIQPTSLGGNWTTDDLETIVESYLQPHYQLPSDDDDGNRTADDDSVLSLMDMLWPTMDYMDTMKSRRRAIRKKDPELASAIKKNYISKEDRELGEAFVFLSPDNFNKLDRSVIRRMAVYDHCQKVMPYKSTSLHFKSICRLLQINNDQQKSTSSGLMAAPVPPDTREYLSWFMLTSACLSRGAQGQPTPYRDPTTDSMSYSNFELGVLFCSRMVGDSQNDRLYVSDPNHVNGCQCGKGKRFYKYWQANGELLPNFVDNVKKVHLPVPYNLRPKSYQQDPDSDMMSWTPYLTIPKNNTSSASVGNMKLTPLGEKIARDLTTDSPKGVRS